MSRDLCIRATSFPVIAAVLMTSLTLLAIPALRQTATCLEMIEGAQRRGLDVTTEAYPYTATQTRLESAIYDEGWQV